MTILEIKGGTLAKYQTRSRQSGCDVIAKQIVPYAHIANQLSFQRFFQKERTTFILPQIFWFQNFIQSFIPNFGPQFILQKAQKLLKHIFVAKLALI